MTDTPDIVRMIAEKLDAGVLPHDQHAARWVRDGQGRPCAACALRIAPGQAEHELTYPDGRRLHLHALCAGLYEAEIVRREPPPSP